MNNVYVNKDFSKLELNQFVKNVPNVVKAVKILNITVLNVMNLIKAQPLDLVSVKIIISLMDLNVNHVITVVSLVNQKKQTNVYLQIKKQPLLKILKKLIIYSLSKIQIVLMTNMIKQIKDF